MIWRKLFNATFYAFIDAAHEFKPAYRDCKDYWPLLSSQGVLFGDDYGAWPGVTKAAKKFAKDIQRPLFGKKDKFVISKGDHKINILPEVIV